MSLLDDLLSKIKTNTSQGGDDNSPMLDLPPTLSKTQKIPPKVQGLRSRYVVLTALVLALVGLGALVTARLVSKGTPVAPPLSVRQPRDFKTAPFDAGRPPTGRAPDAAASATLQSNAARMNLGEPPAPTGQGKRVAGRAPCPPCPPRGGDRPKVQPAPAPPRRETAAPIKVDAAARDSLLYAARTAEQSSDWKSALAGYRKAQEIDPGNYKIMSNISAALNNLGMFQDGAREAERALERKPDYVPALINAAIGRSSTGNTQKARRLFNSALAIDPGNKSVLLNLGILHERSGNLDEAAAAYRQLAAEGDPAALEGMGRIYERKGKKAEAVRSYRQILAQPGAGAALKKQVKGRLARMEE